MANDEMVEAAENIEDVEQEVDPLEAEKTAAENFFSGIHHMKALAKSAPSKGALVRVLLAGIEFPLGKQYPRLLSKHEKTMFNLYQSIMQNKEVLMNYTLKEMLKNQGEGNGEEIMAEDRNTTEG